MALELRGGDQRLSLEHEPSVFALAEQYGMECPELIQLGTAAQASHAAQSESAAQPCYAATSGGIERLLLEVEAVLTRYQRERRDQLQRDNHIYSRDARQVEAIISGLMVNDTVVHHLSRVVNLFAAALHGDGTLEAYVVEDDTPTEAGTEASAPKSTAE
jgi:hypothetical protein